MFPKRLARSRDRKSRDRKKVPFRRSLLEHLELRRLLAREVSGILPGDDVWSGTIHVRGNVTIPDGVNLQVNPGTVVKFDQGQALFANGALQAIGTPAAPIVFTAAIDDIRSARI
jgi:hypothetical protein